MKTNGTNYLNPNIQLFAEGGGDTSASASNTTPAATTAASTTSTGDGNGTQTTTAAAPTAQTETKPFKSFSSEADYQKEVDFRVQQALKTHEEKLKGKLTPEIRKQLEAEANMTAEQKVQAQLDQLAVEKKELAKEKVRIKVESLFATKGISEADRQPMLDSVVDDNEEESMKRGKALIDAIDRATNEKIKAAMTQVKAPGTGSAKDGKTTDASVAFAKERAKRRSEISKAANAGLDYYIHGGKK